MSIVGIVAGAYVKRDDATGRSYLINPLLGDTTPYECGSGPNQIDCNLPFAPVNVAGLTDQQATDIAIALLDVNTQIYAAAVGPLGDAALSSLSPIGVAKISPTLAAVAYSPQTANTPIQDTIAANPGLYEQIQRELVAGTQALEAAGVRTDYNPDPGSPSSINMYQRYLMAIDTAAPLQPLVQQQLEKDVGLLDDLFGSGGFTSSVPSYSPIPTFSSTVFDPIGQPTAGSPPISTTSGGILDTLGNIFTSALPYVPNILTSLSNAGVIGGTVGQLFQTPQVAPMSVAGLGAVSASPVDPCQAALDQQGYLGYSLCKLFGTSMPGVAQNPMIPLQPTSPQQLMINSGLCGQRGPSVVDMLTAPGLFRLGCGGLRTVGRVIAQKPNGTRDLYVRVGQIASPSPRALKRFAKRWAKEAGLHCGPRSSGRRSSYRRRRPR